MKLKSGFVLREVAGENVVVATGRAGEGFHGMISLNDTGKEIWLGLEEGLSEAQIRERLMQKYEVDSETAERDVEELVEQIRGAGFLEKK